LAAIGVSFMIAHIGWSLGWGGVIELVDTGLNSQQLTKIKQVIESTDGVIALHELRTRKMGGTDILIDLHILVNPKITVSEGHQIGEKVRGNLKGKVENIKDVLVHVDPENDENINWADFSLPSRIEITERLQQEKIPIEHVNLHYLSGKMSVDVYVVLPENIQDIQVISQYFAQLSASEPCIETVNVYYCSK
jgi:hypothetical protein